MRALIAAIAAANSDAHEAALVFAGAGIRGVTLDLYLITGRSVVNEGGDTLPAPVELTVKAPGSGDVTRKVRVPDITRVHFDLVPAPAPAPTPAAPSP